MIVRNLSKQIQENQILSKVSLQVNEGELVAVLGASGSGKTTLLKCLALKSKWDEGQYIYEGKDITKPSIIEKLRFAKHWAYLEEKPMLNLKKNALKNVLSGRIFHTPLWRIITRQVEADEHMNAMDYLDKVGLLDKAAQPVEKLSGGERQRIAIAKALCKGSKVIFADEPVSAVEPASAERIMQDFKSICEKDHVTVICTMHKIELAEKYASRIIGIAGGRIVLDVAGRHLTQRERNLIF